MGLVSSHDPFYHERHRDDYNFEPLRGVVGKMASGFMVMASDSYYTCSFMSAVVLILSV